MSDDVVKLGKRNWKAFCYLAWDCFPVKVQEAWAQTDPSDYVISAGTYPKPSPSASNDKTKRKDDAVAQSKRSKKDPDAPKMQKDPDAPKRPSTSYLFFANETRPTLDGSNMTPQQKTAELGRMWKDLNEKEKIPYETKAAKDRERYAEEMASYKSKK